MKPLTFIVSALALCCCRGIAQPTLALSLVPKVSINAVPGTVSTIQYSTNLNDSGSWVTLTTVRVTRSPFDYIDAAGTVFPQRYYRAMTISTNPGPLDMVWISPGTFTMGSPTNEVGRSDNEGPQTTVTISHGYWIGRYEITEQQFTNVLGTYDWYYFYGNDLPAQYINWSTAVRFCSTLTDLERQAGRLPSGYVYRLPTEAEWEYAVRAGSTNRYFFGDDISGSMLLNYAWCSLNAGSTVHPVGGKLPNAWGLYDVAGNVYEYCLDYYAATLPGGSVTDPVGPATGMYRVAKGGGFQWQTTTLRSAARWTAGEFYRDVGFRVVLGVEVR